MKILGKKEKLQILLQSVFMRVIRKKIKLDAQYNPRYLLSNRNIISNVSTINEELLLLIIY